MQIEETMILPVDLLLLPVTELPEQVRQQIEAAEGDYALTRPNSRTPSRIVDSAAAELLREFRSPITIVDAVIRYSRARHEDPEKILEEAFPLLERLTANRLLVPSNSDEARHILPSLKTGSRLMKYEVIRCIQSLDDTELYQVRSDDGTPAALKLGRPNAPEYARQMFEREAALLSRLNGEFAPRLLQHGISESGQQYLLMEWCEGKDCAVVSHSLRMQTGVDLRPRLLALCWAILNAYAQIHRKNVIHSDIHPRNVLIQEAAQVKIIDFGFARISGIESEYRRAQRAGVAYFFEPEYARGLLKGSHAPASSALGEQYALAALLYNIVTGKHYLDLSLEKEEMLRQITEDPPLSFAARGLPAWPAVEQVLGRALSKQPQDRFANVAEFAEAMASVARRESIAAETPTVPAAFPEAQQMLRSMLERMDISGECFAKGLEFAPRASLTYGSAGIAYALYRIACCRDNPRLLAAADLWAARAAREAEAADAFYSPEIDITPEVVGRVSPYHNVSGVYAVQFLIATAQGDVLAQQMAMERFLGALQSAPCENLDVTLGRSGALLGATLVVQSVLQSKYLDATALLNFGNETLQSIWGTLDTYRPIRECKQISYAGAAHGWAGILFAALTWCRVTGAPLPSSVEERLHQLARMSEPMGRRTRWKWSTGPSSHAANQDAYMAGWCNGSAGFVYLWTLAHRMLGRAEYGELATGAAWDAWESEAQIGNLCCGYGGQAYALLQMYRHSGDAAWLHRAQTLAQKAARSIREMPSTGVFQDLVLRADSLYKGEAGVALLAADLEQPEYAVMPFFVPED